MNSSVKTLNKILYAEDDPDIRSLVEMTFTAMTDYDLVSCKDGLEAMEQSRNLIPDLVLLDVMMPKMDGLTLYDYLRKQENYRNIPTILMTAKVQSHEVEEYKKMGVIGVIPKPFDPVQLPQILESLWNDFQNQR